MLSAGYRSVVPPPRSIPVFTRPLAEVGQPSEYSGTLVPILSRGVYPDMRHFRFAALCRIAVLSFYAGFGSWPALLQAQESYFVTYSHQMEEPGNLEIAVKSVTGAPKGGNPFVATALEFEYGVNGWWTAELYIDGQTTIHESTVFTGFRVENRIRPLLREHWINPVLYFEFEDLNAADKALLEVVGHDTREDLIPRNSRAEKEHEAEFKLILSSNFKGWNVSENFIAEKNLGPFSWEFGYALGRVVRWLSRRVRMRAISVVKISRWAQNYTVVLANVTVSGFRIIPHYLAPVLAWDIPRGPSIRVSPTFGLNRDSNGFLFRFMLLNEIDQFFSRLRGQP